MGRSSPNESVYQTAIAYGVRENNIALAGSSVIDELIQVSTVAHQSLTPMKLSYRPQPFKQAVLRSQFANLGHTLYPCLMTPS